MSEFDDLLARVRSGEAPSAPKQPDDIDYKSLLGQVRGKPDPSIAQATLTNSAYSNPDQEAEKIRLAREMKTRFGEDWSPMAIDMAEAKRRLAVEDGVNAMDKAPTLAAKMTDTSFANVAHDDMTNLSSVEDLLKYVVSAPGAKRGGMLKDIPQAVKFLATEAPGAVASGGLTFGAGAYGLAAAPFELVGMDSAGQWLREKQKATQAQADWMAGITPETGFVERSVKSGLQSAGQTLMTLPVGMVSKVGQAAYMTGENAMLAIMGATTAGQSYGKAREEGATPAVAAANAIEDAVYEVTFEKYLGASGLLKNIKAGASAGKLFMYELGKELPGEIATTLGQNFNEWMNVHPDKSVGDFLSEQPEAIASTIIGTLAGGTTQIGAVKSIEKATAYMANRERDAAAAEQNAGALTALRDLAVASKVRERGGDTFQDFVRAASEDGPVQNVYVDSRIFMQSAQDAGVSPAEFSDEIKQQMAIAVQTGGDVRIPIDEFAAKIAPTDFGGTLIEHLKTDPNGMSQAESRIFFQSGGKEETERQVERALAQTTVDNSFKESQARVKDAVLANMNAAGRFTPEKNEVDATIFASYMAVRGAQVGLTAEQFAARRQIAFSTQEVTADGQKYDQAGNLRTETPEFTQWFGKSTIVDEAGKPKQMYHGTAQDINTFKAKQAGAIFVTDKPDFAENFSEMSKDWMVDHHEEILTPEQFALAKDAAEKSIRKEFESEPDKADLLVHEMRVGDRLTNIKARSLFNKAIAEQMPSGPNIIPLYVSAQNPFDYDNPEHVAAVVAELNKDTNQWGEPRGDKSQPYLKSGNWEEIEKPTTQAAIKAAGFDGFYVKEGKEKNLAVYNSNQVKSVFNKAPTESANILKQSDQNDLVITHNLSESNLMHAVKMGGIPVPSLAITHKNAPVEGFGEITLIGSEKLADPKGYANTKVFGADIYSPRYPSIEYKLDKFALKRLNRELEPFRAEGEREVYGSSISRIDDLTSIKAFKEYADAKVGHEASWDELKTAASQLLSSVGADEKIFQGYTYSGNRRYTPHTIENVVKILKKELRGGEGFNYGVGSLRAKFTPQFKSVAQIKKEKGRLVSKEAFDEIKKEIDDEFFALANTFGKNINPDTAIAILEDAPKMGIKRSAKQFDIELSDDAAMQAAEFLTRLKNLPTQYFEAKILREVGLNEFAGAVVPAGSDQSVFDALEKAGIKDIKTYEPGNQADRTAKIGEFDKLFFQGPRGQIAFGKDIAKDVSVMSLFKGADLSTVQHELMHFFLESDVALASELVMQARMFGFDSLQQGERDILKDVSAMMNYVGITGTVEEQMDAWHTLSMEEKTPKHEKIAESFEHYLFSGKAPSIELQTYFQRIAAWMRSVYTSLKDFLAKHPDAGDLDPTVRAVFDRMLATTEQIQLAEQARSMMPLFTSPQQAGMTVEEFADYQSLDVDATREAIDELQTRTLRDLAWVENAKGREIKKLQKEAAARRAEMSIEARREVMSQPVYRAWQFLTNKLTTEAKEALKSEPPRKSRAGSVDPSIDSLFVAIAKLGGLDKAQVASQWGWDSKERSPQPMFGQPLLRKEGGKSIDEMAQLLAGYRYLGFDTEGTYDLSEFEAKFEEEYRGAPQYSLEHDYEAAQGVQRAGEGVDLERIGSGRFDLIALKEMGFTQEMIDIIVDLKMTAKDGIHPDLVADEFDFTSGDELVRTLAIAEAPKVAIQQLTDQKMMERYGDLATPEAIEQAADQAIHNDARARFVATELNALAKATGSPRLMVAAAKNYAQAMIGKLLVRNLKPTQYASAEVRAAKAAQDAMAKGDTATAAAEKRNQLINNYATKAAYEAKADIDKAIAYFKRVQKPGKLPATHYDQILSLLAKYDLKEKTLKSIDNVTAFRTWAKGQLDIGNIPPNVDALLTPEQRMQFQMQLNERNDDGELIYPNEEDQALLLASYVDQMPVRNYKEVSVEELLGLRDAIKQIEHIGRRTKKVLTDRKNREFDALVQEIKTHITEVAERTGRRSGDTRTPNDKTGQSLLSWRGFFFSHIKAANIIHVMDGESGGPLWESLMKTANDAANGEVLDLAEAHDVVQGMLAKLKGIGEITDRPKFFPTIDRSLNRQARIAMAMNLGNESNMQRLLGGEGWTMEQIKPVLDTLTTEDWNFVQGMWDYYETFRPRVGEMERLINGVEPKWVEARPIEVQTADGDTLNLRGGYAPVIFDPRASGRAASFAAEKDAKSMMQAARVASTVSKSFTKARVDEVNGRPLLLSLDGFIGGIQDTIHYLHWQPWIIDANRLVKAVDAPVREYYGAEVVKLLRDWTGDNAAGMKPARDAGERAITNLARNVSFVGLAYNVMSAVKQVTGYSQSVVVVGRKWFAKGIARSMASPRQAYLDAVEKSDFMKKRASTRMRDLAETRNTVQDQGKIREGMEKGGYAMMLFMQTAVDVPTWWAGYEKAIDAGHDEDMAVSLADQSVIDSQGGGLQKDLASVERATGAIRLLTGFMSFMNTTMNLNYRVLRSEATVGSKAIDLLLINTVPVLLSAMLGYLFTPGGEDKEPEDVAAGLLADQVGFLLGQMLGFREIQQVGYAAMGKPQGDYGGSVGTRIFSDMLKLAKQVGQGEMDDALRKAVVNAVSDFARLPGAQINRTITGAEAIYEGETMNPAALVFGYQKP
jgi:hypothetical protein